MKKESKYRKESSTIKTLLIAMSFIVVAVLLCVIIYERATTETTADENTGNTVDQETTPANEQQTTTSDTVTDASPSPTQTSSPTPLPSPTPVPLPSVLEECLPENFPGFNHDIIIDGKTVDLYDREDKIFFSPPPLYSSMPGVTTFRGNNWRDSAAYGTADINEKTLEKVWSATTGYIDIWTGVGWTGQPVIVEWDDNTREIMNLYPQKKYSGLVEVIYATLDGNIYFFDLNDGTPTRDSIDALYPFKGSASVDPRGYPLLYAGQGIEEKEGEKVPCGLRIFSLIDGNEIYFIDGYDPHIFRWWPAFDAGALIDSATDTLIQCGENGIIYSVNLNTDFSHSAGTIGIDPEITRYRYRSPYGTKIGFESSPVGYANLIYVVDNSGLLQCIDINTLEPIWVRYVSDDTDSTMVLEESGNNQVYLYTACEVDLQGPGGMSYISKINALSGNLEWETAFECFHDDFTNGGALATPVLGKHDIDNLVIFNIAKVGEKNQGSLLIAFDKETGDTVWSINMDFYSWSSPVAVYDENGRSYLIICDSGGYMRLIEGKTGNEIDSIWLESNIEASPAVYGNMVVVGTRGQKIWGIRIK